MSVVQNELRVSFIQFVVESPKNKGWWFILPDAALSIRESGLKSEDDGFDRTEEVFPHTGTMFGLSAEAMNASLHEIGFLKKHGKGYRNVMTEWYNLAADKKRPVGSCRCLMQLRMCMC